MQVDSMAPLAVPAEHGVMQHAHALAVAHTGLELRVIQHLAKRRRMTGLAPSLVMVAAHQNHLAAVDAAPQGVRPLDRDAVREVAQHVERVRHAHAVVDVGDKLRVHAVYGRERAVGSRNDIGMPKVRIGGEPDHKKAIPHIPIAI